MWDRLILSTGLGFWCGDQALKEDIEAVEQSLAVALPRSLRGFLAEMDGCAVNLAGLEIPDNDTQMVKLIWSCEEIIKRNQDLRSVETTAQERHMAYRDLLWFANQPNGDLAGFRVMDSQVVEPTVFVYNPNQVTEPRPQGNSLRQYITAVLKEYRGKYGTNIWNFE